MAGYLLTNTSTIMCPHGGIITHIPATQTSYRIKGELPMLLNDVYIVNGCGFNSGTCTTVTWVLGAQNLYIQGIPALTHTSIGLCNSASGGAMFPALVVMFQTEILEPDEFTQIDN